MFPERLETGEMLVGVGERSFELGFVQQRFYQIGLYVDHRAAADDLKGFKGFAQSELCNDGEFFERFSKGAFRKILRIEVSRTMWNERVKKDLEESLKKRVAAECVPYVKDLVSKLPELIEGDIVMFTLDGDGEHVRMSRCSTTLFEVRSSAMWFALQRVWLDGRNKEMIPLRNSLIANLPKLLLRAPTKQEDTDHMIGTKSLAPSDFAQLEERLEHVLEKLDKLDRHVRCVPQLQKATFHAGFAIGALVILLVVVCCLHASDTCQDAARALFSLFVMILIASVNAFRWKWNCQTSIDRLYPERHGSEASGNSHQYAEHGSTFTNDPHHAQLSYKVRGNQASEGY